MNSRMFKYVLIGLDDFGVSGVDIPASATIKHIALQNTPYGSGIMAWAEVVTDDYKVPRKFTLIATGEEIPDNSSYMKTIEFPSGTVWHLYEIKE